MYYKRCITSDNMTRKIVAFDIGRKNLACAIENRDSLRFDGANVQHIAVYNVHAASVGLMIPKLIDTLQRICSEHGPFACVLIEQQPCRNIAMKCLSHCVHAYFACSAHKPLVLYRCMKAALKTSATRLGVQLRSNMTYKQRKDASVSLAMRALGPTSPWCVHIKSVKKKDDFCDALLHLVAY